ARESRRSSSGIPPRYMTAKFETFKAGSQDNALNKCKEYAEEYPVGEKPRGYRSLYLWSTNSWGTGKTHLASAICHCILDRWDGTGRLPYIIFTSEPDLFRRIQATYSYDFQEQRTKESESDIINQIASADLVVLDDVGKEPRSDMRFVRRTLFAIINARYDSQLPLVVTANLNPTGLKSHLDEPPTEASFNRFISMIKQKHIHMDGESYRKHE
ncbi:MAG: ATP-binding protein, partial [Dehalococcoidales bacterium]|nr:ATP-binding protein [Dehalococcoidales bacterium]